MWRTLAHRGLTASGTGEEWRGQVACLLRICFALCHPRHRSFPVRSAGIIAPVQPAASVSTVIIVFTYQHSRANALQLGRCCPAAPSPPTQRLQPYTKGMEQVSYFCVICTNIPAVRTQEKATLPFRSLIRIFTFAFHQQSSRCVMMNAVPNSLTILVMFTART